MASMNFDYVQNPKYTKAGSVSTRITYRKPTSPNSDYINESQLEPRKCRYNPTVLVGNWFDRRVDYKPPPDDWTTVYDSTYTCKKNSQFERDRKMYEEYKTKAKGLGSDFLLEHYGQSFYNNYTTTNDVFYRVIPLGLCGPRRRKYSSRKDLWVLQIDPSKNYGNVTNFGLNEAYKCDTYINSLPSPRTSIHDTSYKKPKPISVKRIPRPKGLFNEPNLAHLDIDVNEPFKPRFAIINK